MRVSIDQEKCQGDCICEVICPEVFVLDDAGIAWVAIDGIPLSNGGAETYVVVPKAHEGSVRDAMTQCPTQCMNVQ
jgi:ferredoxin